MSAIGQADIRLGLEPASRTQGLLAGIAKWLALKIRAVFAAYTPLLA
jgi:hypothetical protein